MTPRTPWVTVPVFFGLFFGGGFVGVRLSEFLAPESVLAEFVGIFVFPTAFAAGYMAWFGASLPTAVRGLLELLRSPGRRLPRVKNTSVSAPPGSFAFLPAAVTTCTLWGAFIGVLSTELRLGWVICLYAMLGLVYGLVCWKLAQTGYLAFPRE